MIQVVSLLIGNGITEISN